MHSAHLNVAPLRLHVVVLAKQGWGYFCCHADIEFHDVLQLAMAKIYLAA